MKNLITLFLFCFMAFHGFAKGEEKLPEVPWRAIAETCTFESFNDWAGDISIKLFGNYDSTDIRMIENSINELNPLLETIHLVFSDYERGNIEIYFLDSTNIRKYESIITISGNEKSTWRSSFNSSRDVREPSLFKLAFNLEMIPTEYKQNFITNNLAFSLYPYIWMDAECERNNYSSEGLPPSLFRSIEVKEREQLFYGALPEFDQKLLRAVYSPDFQTKLALAKEQYKTSQIPQWLRKNAYQFMLLPFGILLLLLLWVFLRVSKGIERLVANKFVRFNLNSTIGLAMVAIVSVVYFAVSDSIRNYSPIIPKPFFFEFWLTTSSVILIGLPAVNLLRLVEKLIHKNTHKKVMKIVLIFLSTGLIPYSAIFAFAIISISNRRRPPMVIEHDMKVLAYLFMASMIIAAFRALISYFFFKEKELIVENETKLLHLREAKSRAELNALHSKINPHFLYNSLNSIAGLAHTDAAKTEHMALSLSKLFRYSINKEKSDWTSFKEELEMVKIYLDVEKVRFDERLRYSIEIDPELENQKVPRFVIQPLVENAVKHGISKSVTGGEIGIRIVKEGRHTVIRVTDSGPAFPKDLIPGFGIQSIYDKLEILYPERFEMSFINTPEKQVFIKLK